MSIECEVCHKTPLRDGIAVYRINETGVAGLFRCEDHMNSAIDPVVLDIVHIIEDDNLGLT